MHLRGVFRATNFAFEKSAAFDAERRMMNVTYDLCLGSKNDLPTSDRSIDAAIDIYAFAKDISMDVPRLRYR